MPWCDATWLVRLVERGERTKSSDTLHTGDVTTNRGSSRSAVVVDNWAGRVYLECAQARGFSPRRSEGAVTAPSDPSRYCVRTATLVEPRITPPGSLKRTNTRLVAGLKGTMPVPATNTLKVGVPLVLIVSV